MASIVQAVGANTGGGGGTLTATISAATAGNTIVIFAQDLTSASSITGVTDNTSGGSNIYNAATTFGAFSLIYLANVINGGATTVSITGAGKKGAIIIELSGVYAIVDNGAVNINWPQSLTTTPHSNNVTTLNATDVALGFTLYWASSGANLAASGTVPGGASWTALTGTGLTLGTNSNAGNSDLFGMSAFTTATGTFQATMTGGSTSSYDSGIIVLQQVPSISSSWII